MNLFGKVIRSCNHCKAIYIDTDKYLHRIEPCKFCGLSTGFFDSFSWFYRNIDLYGIDTDNIKDTELKNKVMQDYGVAE